jgi:hypothetical protein
MICAPVHTPLLRYAVQVIKNDMGTWPPPAKYLQLDRSHKWAGLHPRSIPVDGVGRVEGNSSSQVRETVLERSVRRLLEDMLTVPVVREAVRGGKDVPVDLAFVVRPRDEECCQSIEEEIYVAVEAQGPQHFVSPRCPREIRSSRLKRLLRQFAGWRVVSIDHKVWSKMPLDERQDMLRDELADLPNSVWRTPQE